MKKNELGGLYHVNTELSPETTGEFVRQMVIDSPLARPMAYSMSETVELHPERLKGSLVDSLKSRVSSVQFKEAVDLKSLSSLINYSLAPGEIRVNGLRQRPYPSAGGLYSVSNYIFAQKIDGLESGIYHINADKGVLEVIQLLSQNKITELTTESVITYNVDGEPSFYILLVANLELLTRKYGDRGYRFALLEAGHIAQNLGLVATALDLKHLPLGGFCESLIEEAIGIRNKGFISLHLLAFGGS